MLSQADGIFSNRADVRLFAYASCSHRCCVLILLILGTETGSFNVKVEERGD